MERSCTPSERDARYRTSYGLNVAQYLVDLHDSKAVFNFCGSLLFQLSLTDELRDHLAKVASADQPTQQPVIFDASVNKMSKMPNYAKSATADDVTVFHGREVRQAQNASGGMGCVLQLSLSNETDAEGWTAAELKDYNGWGHDSRRPWRKGMQLEKEGCQGYCGKFGNDAYGLHHRFYLHYDRRGVMWLSAEDGCEGEPYSN
eukprot:TRINITY_DN54403_c0_g1_i1.p1 TRINITY_DN54403_c0_g1~~TRINITY_DN54403_c0_g1_i1.p1  ORF type:complete len:203 (-),score=13.62 TRINITY_DN54403_c0_g1_i1:221-829(-)